MVATRGMARVGVVCLIGLAFAPVALAQDAAPDSPWSVGLIASMLALSLGALAAVFGMWIGRDKERPAIFAVAMTALIVTAVGVGIVQSYLDAVDGVQKRADLERMMGMVRDIAIKTGDAELAALIAAEGGEPVELPEPAAEPEPTEDEAEDTDAAGTEDGDVPAEDGEPTEDGEAPAEDGEGTDTPSEQE